MEKEDLGWKKSKIEKRNFKEDKFKKDRQIFSEIDFDKKMRVFVAEMQDSTSVLISGSTQKELGIYFGSTVTIIQGSSKIKKISKFPKICALIKGNLDFGVISLPETIASDLGLKTGDKVKIEEIKLNNLTKIILREQTQSCSPKNWIKENVITPYFKNSFRAVSFGQIIVIRARNEIFVFEIVFTQPSQAGIIGGRTLIDLI